MSKVWRRLQRVGKTAYKFEFTIKVHTVTLECVSGWTPEQVSVLWVRKGRRVRTEATSWTTLPGKDTQGVVHWQALEATMTLYMDTNTHKRKFDEKYWTLIVENVGKDGKHKALATKRINMAQFVDPALRILETRQKYQMKPVARKVHLTELQVTFISKFERQGPAMDDDMRSITSEMSQLTLAGFEDGYMSEGEGDYNENTTENEQIMREIAAIGADFHQLSKFNEEPAVVESNGVNTHEQMLIVWARDETAKYSNISITDMRDSWADGAGFCAIIHTYHPELVNIALLRDPYTNVKLATRAAVQLGISPTVDPLDFHKGKLDKLGILTFVDQLYQKFKDCIPKTDAVMRHRELKKSPEHKRKTASIISQRKPDLEGSEEEKRRKDMIARGRLRQSKRRPRKFESDNSIDSKSVSPSPNKIARSPASLQRSPLHMNGSPIIQRQHEFVSSVPQRSTTLETPRSEAWSTPLEHRTTQEIVEPSAPPVEELHLKNAPARDAKLEDQESVTGSSGIITDSPSHLAKSMLTSSFENDVYTPGMGADDGYTTGTGLDPDELMKEFERQSPCPGKREEELSVRAESPDPLTSRLPSAQLEDYLSTVQPPSYLNSTEPPTEMRTQQLEAALLLEEEEEEVSSQKEEDSPPESPTREDSPERAPSVESCDAIMQALEAEVIKSPSSIKISGISSTDDVLDAIELEEKLNDSRSGVAIVMESIRMEEFDKKYSSGPIKTPQAVADTYAKGYSSSSDDDTAAGNKIAVLDNLLATVDPPAEPTDDNKFEDEIQAEIAALEEQLNSSFIFKPEPEPEPEVILQPTPPVTPPAPRRGPSLRDKIRGLHTAREKLMAACPDPSDEKKPPAVLPKPMDRKISQEKIALLRSSSQESDRRSCDSAKLSDNVSVQSEGLGPAAPTQDTPPDTPQDTPPDSPEVDVSVIVKSPEPPVSSPEVSRKSPVPPEARHTVPAPVLEPVNQRTLSASRDSLPVNQEELSASRDSLPTNQSSVSASSPSGCVSCKIKSGRSSPAAPGGLGRTSPAGSKSPKKPAAPQFQSLSELVSSFSVKTEPEATHEQPTEERTGSRSSTPSNVDMTFGSRDMAFGSRDMAFGSRDNVPGSSLHGFAGDRDVGSSMSSMNSEPPPPPPPEPLMMMMGPGYEEESEESDTEQTEIEIKQDLKDVRNYMTECHRRITQHNEKLDKRAKVLERELRDVMDAQNHELEQTLLKSWLQLVHERNTLVRKQDELNSLQNEEDLEDKCCQVLKEMKKYQNMRDSNKNEADLEREEQLEQEYKDILKKRETLLRIRDDINTISLEEEAEFQSVLEKPKLLQDQSSCKIA